MISECLPTNYLKKILNNYYFASFCRSNFLQDPVRVMFNLTKIITTFIIVKNYCNLVATKI